ncbi:hypothetical protein H5410_061104, partial [Solanum commersonii]
KIWYEGSFGDVSGNSLMHLAIRPLHCFTESFDATPIIPLHRRISPFLQGSAHLNKRRICDLLVIRRLGSAIHRSSFLHSFGFFCSFLRTLIKSKSWTHQHPQLKLLLVLKQTQVQPFKKGVLHSTTQDSIMNAHNKTQFTYAKINYALKDSSSDSPISKNGMLTILASNASLGSTRVFECPHRKNDSIFAHNDLII